MKNVTHILLINYSEAAATAIPLIIMLWSSIVSPLALKVFAAMIVVAAGFSPFETSYLNLWLSLKIVAWTLFWKIARFLISRVVPDCEATLLLISLLIGWRTHVGWLLLRLRRPCRDLHHRCHFNHLVLLELFKELLVVIILVLDVLWTCWVLLATEGGRVF